ncbi:MAG: hypothetical protein ACKO9Z_18435 [Planctomycetota bacterium]|nr:hypothetical protein [Planctomycetota bacterium]
MAEMTIRLRVNPVTGRHEVKVDLESDSDALPHEHEEMHRALLAKLVGAGLVPGDGTADLTVTRGGVVVSAPESGGTGTNGQRRANPAGS